VNPHAEADGVVELTRDSGGVVCLRQVPPALWPELEGAVAPDSLQTKTPCREWWYPWGSASCQGPLAGRLVGIGPLPRNWAAGVGQEGWLDFFHRSVGIGSETGIKRRRTVGARSGETLLGGIERPIVPGEQSVGLERSKGASSCSCTLAGELAGNNLGPGSTHRGGSCLIRGGWIS